MFRLTGPETKDIRLVWCVCQSSSCACLTAFVTPVHFELHSAFNSSVLPGRSVFLSSCPTPADCNCNPGIPRAEDSAGLGVHACQTMGGLGERKDGVGKSGGQGGCDLLQKQTNADQR